MTDQNVTLSLKDLYAPAAERAVASALLLNPTLLSTVEEILPEEDMFHAEIPREIYKVVKQLTEQGKVIDYLTVLPLSPRFSPSILSEMIVEYLNLDFASPLNPANADTVKTYARVVGEAFVKRDVSNKLQRGEDVKSVMDSIAVLERSGLDKFFSPKEIALQVIASLSKNVSTLEFPYPAIQNATTGLQKGQLIIIAARPGCGKTTFLENVGFSIAQTGKKVVFASAEMSAELLAKRTITRLSRYNLFYDPTLKDATDEQKKQVEEAIKLMEQTPYYIHEMFSVGQIENMIKEKARDFDLLIVDYLQLLEPKVKTRSPYERVTAVANEITQLGKKYHLPVLAAAQYNREAAKVAQPTMSDLKESGQLEQNADIIISLWRHHKDPEETVRKVRFDILKNRNGYSIGNFDDQHECFLMFNQRLFEFKEGEVQQEDPFRRQAHQTVLADSIVGLEGIVE